MPDAINPISTARGVTKPSATKAAAAMVGSGILLSRIAGLVRDRVFAHFFGNSDAADAFRAAFRIPNFLQNLFGEGVLSASFIPVYARLRAENKDEEATAVAKAIFALLFLSTSLLVAAGVFATPWLIDAIAPGFHGEKRALTILLVRILFPGAGLLVFSAWCLGILNSHGKFFLSYTAPVIWNAALITAMLWRGPNAPGARLAEILAWASVVGSGLQFGIQLPFVLRLLAPHFWRAPRPGGAPLPARQELGSHGRNVQTVLRNFVPVFVSRGVVQISAYVDALLASFLPTGAVAALSYAQTLYTLPVSLFGMSVSAAELPAMSSALGTAEQVAQTLRERLARGLEQIAFLVVPSAAAFVALGDVVVATLYRSGVFGARDVTYVWGVLAGSAVGLLASTFGRLYSSGFYALRDTRTPLNFAVVRVALTVVLGYFFALPLPPMLGVDRRWGVAGLTLSAGLAGWVEFALLRRSLQLRIGVVPHSMMRVAKLWAAALIAAAAAFGLKLVSPAGHPVLTGIIVLVPYGLIYFALTHWMGVSMLDTALRRLRGR